MNVFSLSWAAAGPALLGLSLFPAGSLALGGAPAHLAVFLLLLALAALALRLLRRNSICNNSSKCDSQKCNNTRV